MTAMFQEIINELLVGKSILSDFGTDLVAEHGAETLKDKRPKDKRPPKKCRTCNRTDTAYIKLRKCARCKTLPMSKSLCSYYCSTTCQEKNWKYHWHEHRWLENQSTRIVLSYKKEFAEHFQDTLKAMKEEEFEETRRLRRYLFEESQQRNKDGASKESQINFRNVLVANRNQQTEKDLVIVEPAYQIPRYTAESVASIAVDTWDIPPEEMPRALKYPRNQMLAITWEEGQVENEPQGNQRPKRTKRRINVKKGSEEDPESKWNLAIDLLTHVVDYRVGGRGTAIRRGQDGKLIRKNNKIEHLKSGIHKKTELQKLTDNPLPWGFYYQSVPSITE
ncbi:uncharacterized protein LOC100185835 [Ciona intestinalis]